MNFKSNASFWVLAACTFVVSMDVVCAEEHVLDQDAAIKVVAPDAEGQRIVVQAMDQIDDMCGKVGAAGYGTKSGITRAQLCSIYRATPKKAGDAQWQPGYEAFLGTPPCAKADDGAFAEITVGGKVGDNERPARFYFKPVNGKCTITFTVFLKGVKREYNIAGEPEGTRCVLAQMIGKSRAVVKHFADNIKKNPPFSNYNSFTNKAAVGAFLSAPSGKDYLTFRGGGMGQVTVKDWGDKLGPIVPKSRAVQGAYLFGGSGGIAIYQMNAMGSDAYRVYEGPK